MNQDQLDALRNSPLFSLSLASKELFHSNFLAWFFELTGADGFNALFGPDLSLSPSKEWKVLREHRKIDISIESTTPKIFIENKVKSLPDVDQLRKYSVALSKAHAVSGIRCILLTATPPLFSELGERAITVCGVTWHVVLYAELLDKMESYRRTLTGLPVYLQELVRDYVAFMQCQVSVMADTVDEWERYYNEPGFLRHGEDAYTSTRYEHLVPLRLHDVFDKVRYELLRQRMALGLREAGMTPKSGNWKTGMPGELFTGSGLSSSSVGQVDSKLIVGAKGNWRAVLGVQIEGEGFRLVYEETAQSPHIEGKAHVLLERGLWFYPFTDCHGRLAQEGKFCSYEKKFFYNYKMVPDMSLQELVDETVRWYQRAFEVMENTDFTESGLTDDNTTT